MAVDPFSLFQSAAEVLLEHVFHPTQVASIGGANGKSHCDITVGNSDLPEQQLAANIAFWFLCLSPCQQHVAEDL